MVFPRTHMDLISLFPRFTEPVEFISNTNGKHLQVESMTEDVRMLMTTEPNLKKKRKRR